MVRQIVTHPEVYRHMVSDGAPSPETYQVFPGGFYLLVRYLSVLLGLFILVPQTTVCFEVHTCFLPVARGKLAFQAYREGMDWLRDNTSCRKVIGHIPKYNRGALAIALCSGCKMIGVNTRSILHDGELHDQFIVGKELA